MAKKAYASVDGIARKVKKIYCGVDGVARKVKKAYVGIGGVARPCFGSGELTYYGAITSMDKARGRLAAATVGNYALFGGGQGDYVNTSYHEFNTVEGYDTALTKVSAIDDMTYSVGKLAAASVGNYAVFAGGNELNNQTSYSGDAYGSSLTKTTPTILSGAYSEIRGSSVGDYALFAGGICNGVLRRVVDVVNSSLTQESSLYLPIKLRSCKSTKTQKHALFAGGISSSSSVVYQKYVVAFDSSLTRSLPTDLSDTMCVCGAVTGDYALFINNSSTTVDAYDSALTKTAIDALNAIPVSYCSGASIGEYALFVSCARDSVAFDSSLTRTIFEDDQSAIGAIMSYGPTVSAVLGNYALFTGGDSAATPESAVITYKIS